MTMKATGMRYALAPVLTAMGIFGAVLVLHSGSVKAQTQSNPWITQPKSYDNYQLISGYGGSIPAGGTLSGVLQSDDFGFTPTQGNYNVTLTSATFDDRGYIGGLYTNKPGSSCGAPATYSPLPVNLPNVTIVGHRLQVDIAAYDSCPQNIGWQNVRITWAARSNIPPCTLSIAPAIAMPGGVVNVTGTGFSSFNNTVQATNVSNGSRSFSSNNLASPNSTLLSFTVPTDVYPGQYTLSVPSQPGCTTTSLQIKSVSSAPSNLTGALDKTGKVTLNWIDNSTDETGFDIERANDQTNFSSIAKANQNASTYSYDLDSTPFGISPKQFYRVRAALPDGTFTNFSNTAAISSCVPLSGSGPIKIVFMRGESFDPDAKELIRIANEAVSNGFAATEPFKSNIGKFSFYADLTQFNDTNISIWDKTDVNELKSISACGGDAKDYIMYVNTSVNSIGNAISLAGYGFSALNESDLAKESENNIDQAVVAMHEIGHSFAGLLDEYTIETDSGANHDQGDLKGLADIFGISSTKNCTASPFSDYLGLNNRAYGSVNDIGCTYLLSNTYQYGNSNPAIAYYRPSDNSIMRHVDNDPTIPGFNKFNVISCGYVLAAINGSNPLTASRADAAPYWPVCMSMATSTGSIIADGIPPLSPQSTISKISDKTLAPGSDPMTQMISKRANKTAPANITITGSNFSTTPSNTIHFTNTLSSSIYYDITGLASPDGKTLTFSLPDNIPVGKYNLQVGAFNSDWSKAISVSVLAAGSAPTKAPPTAAANPGILPLYDFGGMYGGNPTNINPATGALSCPSGYGPVLVYNSKGNTAYNVYVCMRAHVSGQDPLYDFGGIYETSPYMGGPGFDNIATANATCPSGFSSGYVLGGNASTDGKMYFCYSPYTNGNRFYNFGGMYGSAANIVTGAKSCPAGYSSFTMSTLPVTYCYQQAYPIPSTPTLTATALSGNQIQLSWTTSSTGGLTAYTIHDYPAGATQYVDTTGNMIHQILHTLVDPVANTTATYLISNLSPKTQYCYSIKAISIYNVAESKTVCATTKAASVAPVVAPTQQSLPSTDQTIANPVIPAPVQQTTVVATATSSAPATQITPAPLPAPSAPASTPSVTASLLDASSDKAGTFGVFGPGKGAQNSGNPYDWHFTTTIVTAGKTVKSIRLLSNDNWQGWSTIDPGNYPMVVYLNGAQINSSYSSLNKSGDTLTFDLYGQPETSTAWPGGNILVTFTDGTTASAQIAASAITIPSTSVPTTTANAFDGFSAWLRSIFGW